MTREPIETQDTISIVKVENKLTFQDLIPNYQYQIQGKSVDLETANQMYAQMLEFMNENSELVLNDISNTEEFSTAFKKALAMVRLWISSLYIEE